MSDERPDPALDDAIAEEERRAEQERLATERNAEAGEAELETGEQPLILPSQSGSTDDRTVEGSPENGGGSGS